MKEEKADFLKITKSSLQAFFHIPLHLFFEIREACACYTISRVRWSSFTSQWKWEWKEMKVRTFSIHLYTILLRYKQISSHFIIHAFSWEGFLFVWYREKEHRLRLWEATNFSAEEAYKLLSQAANITLQ